MPYWMFPLFLSLVPPEWEENLRDMKTVVAYYKGQWIPADQLCWPIDDLGFTLGATVVERLRTFQSKVFRMEDHLQRLRRSLDILGWNAEKIYPEVETAIEALLEQNALCIDPGDDWTIVALVTPGRTPDAANPTICVTCCPLEFANWASQFQSGIDAVIVDTHQVPANCWPAELKCRSRIHFYLADRQANAQVPGAKAILLDQDGTIGEATTANVVAYFADQGFVTPSRSKVLPGVSQQVLFELADSLEIPRSECDLTPQELSQADELFFTSTSVCLLPVVRLDQNPIGQGTPGAVYKKMLATWSSLVGVDIAAQANQFAKRGSKN